MNNEIKEVIKLLTEIDKICRKEEILYYLGPQLTLCAVTGQELPGPFAGTVYMRTEDMERFRLAVEREAPEGRIVESMNNNKYFYGFFLRYTDLNTLCFRLNEGRSYKYHGMGVNIIPLRRKIKSRPLQLWTKFQETGWNEIADHYGAGRGRKKAACGAAMRLRLLTGRARLARSLYGMLSRRMNTGNMEGASSYVVCLKEKTVYFPKKIFAETGTVEIDGKKFSVPGNTDLYLKKYYGADYRKKILEKYTPRFSEVVSVRIRYEDYLQETGDQKSLMRQRLRARKQAERSYKRRDYMNECWDYVKFCASKITLEKYYLDNKDYIINLYKNKDYPALEKIFAQYAKANTKSLETDEVFVPDEELQHIFVEVLEKTGNVKLKKKVEKYWK